MSCNEREQVSEDGKFYRKTKNWNEKGEKGGLIRDFWSLSLSPLFSLTLELKIVAYSFVIKFLHLIKKKKKC